MAEPDAPKPRRRDREAVAWIVGAIALAIFWTPRLEPGRFEPVLWLVIAGILFVAGLRSARDHLRLTRENTPPPEHPAPEHSTPEATERSEGDGA